MGDVTLEKLFHVIEVMVKEFGNPLSVISVNYTWLFKLLTRLGIVKTIYCIQDVLKFTGSVITDHKKRHIDGNEKFFF